MAHNQELQFLDINISSSASGYWSFGCICSWFFCNKGSSWHFIFPPWLVNQLVGFWGVPAGTASPQGMKMWPLAGFVAWGAMARPCQRMGTRGRGFFSGELGLWTQPDGTGLERFEAAPLPRTCLSQVGWVTGFSSEASKEKKPFIAAKQPQESSSLAASPAWDQESQPFFHVSVWRSTPVSLTGEDPSAPTCPLCVNP